MDQHKQQSARPQVAIRKCHYPWTADDVWFRPSSSTNFEQILRYQIVHGESAAAQKPHHYYQEELRKRRAGQIGLLRRFRVPFLNVVVPPPMNTSRKLLDYGHVGHVIAPVAEWNCRYLFFEYWLGLWWSIAGGKEVLLMQVSTPAPCILPGELQYCNLGDSVMSTIFNFTKPNLWSSWILLKSI